jgi:hypothetical protein
MKLTLPEQAICSSQELTNQKAINLARQLVRDYKTPQALQEWMLTKYPLINDIWDLANILLENHTAEYLFVEELRSQFVVQFRFNHPLVFGDVFFTTTQKINH